MTNYIGGDHVGRDKYSQSGDNNTMNVTHGGSADVEGAIRELRAFLLELSRAGAVTRDGSVADTMAVVQAVDANRGRLSRIRDAVKGGAKEVILHAVQGSAGALVVALLGV